MEVLKEIKKVNKPKLNSMFLCSYLISKRISPYISRLYISKKTKPNKITLHMISSGILGAVLFAIPNIYIKILGAILIHLWFILDCSDGEVARYTNEFSMYGSELDYTAHLINHPLFGLAIFISLLQLNKYNICILVVIVFLSNFMDYLTRNIVTLSRISVIKEGTEELDQNKKWTLKKKILFISNIFTVYPNFILFGVITYFIDYFVGTNILISYIVLNVILTTIFTIRGLVKLTHKFYSS